MADGDVHKDNNASIDSRWTKPPTEPDYSKISKMSKYYRRWYDPPKDPPGWNKEARDFNDVQKPHAVRPLNDEERQEIQAAANDPKQFENTRQLLSREEFKPTNLLTIGKRKFFVGKIINSGYLVMFCEEPSTRKLMPRIIDHSLSNRSWRSSPGMEGNISKGTGIHYTQEAKPHKDIIRYINWALINNYEASHDGDPMEEYFSIGGWSEAKPAFYTFDKEISKYDDGGALKQFQRYRAGHLSSREVGIGVNLSEEFKNFDFSKPELRAFLPNFTNPPTQTNMLAEIDYEPRHIGLKRGSVTLESYPAQLNGRPIEWVMAHDKMGRVWIERIAFLDKEVNSYGVTPEVIDSGVLTSKPLEYRHQASALKEGEEMIKIKNSGQYVDITPLLDNLLPIRQFRKARGIVRGNGLVGLT